MEALRGTVDQAASEQYMSALAQMTSTIDQEPDVENTGSNVAGLGKLVVARNRLVDEAMGRIVAGHIGAG